MEMRIYVSYHPIKTCTTMATTILFSYPHEIQLHRYAVFIMYLINSISCVYLTWYPGSTVSSDSAQITTLTLIKVKVI